MKRNLLLLGILAVLSSAIAGQQIRNIISPVFAKARRLGNANTNIVLNLAVGMPLRNTNELLALIASQQDPSSPNYHKYLTPAQFNQRFGPIESDYNATADFFAKQGFKVERHSNRTVLDIRGNIGQIEKAFHVRMGRYQHPTENRTFHAPDTEPSVDLTVPIQSVCGLSDYSLPRPAGLKNQAGTGLNGLYLGNDFRRAYVPETTLTGAGQKIAQVQFDSFYPGDPTNYAALAGISVVPVRTIEISGYSSTPGANNSEVALDIEMAMAMAPGLAEIIEYCGGPNTSGDSILNQIAADDTAKQISCSWLWTPWTATTEDLLLQFMAQGQTFLVASGDDLAYDNSNTMWAPADSPYVTAVGGTQLSTWSDQRYLGETVWHDSDGKGSGGGISTRYGLPAWQSAVVSSDNHASATQRNIPDLAMVGCNIEIVADNGISYNVRGTSASAPLMGALVALANQKAASLGQGPVGFINQTIYDAARSASYSKYFHDVLWGDNTTATSPGLFQATTNYDLCTGVGTPNGSNFIDLLVSPLSGSGCDHIELSALTDTVTNGINSTLAIKTLDGQIPDYNQAGTVTAYAVSHNNFYDCNFDDYSTTGFTDQGMGYTYSFNNGDGTEGTANSISLTGGNYNAYDGLRANFNSIQPTHVKFWIKSADTNSHCGYFVMGDSPSRLNSVFHFHLDANNLELVDGPGNSYDLPYQPNRWYKIEVNPDWTTKTISWIVNNKLVLQNLPFCDTNLTGVTMVNIYNYSPNTTGTYDQIRIDGADSVNIIGISPYIVTYNHGVWTGRVSFNSAATNVYLHAEYGWPTAWTGDSGFFNIVRQFTTITLASDPGTGGSASGDGTYASGTAVGLAATANSGWYFTGWSDGNTDNPRNYTAPDTNTTLTAYFAQPAVLNSDFQLNLANGTLQLNVSGTAGRSYTLQKSTDLKNWTDVQTMTLPDSSAAFTDPNASSQRAFYRIRLN